MTANTGYVSFPITGVGRRTAAALVATAAAVVVPQLFHLIGTATGAGAGLAQTWLPMFLPVMLVGLLAGPEVGAGVGLASPLIAFAVTGMPVVSMVPFVTIQLVVCGLTAGVVGAKRLPVVWSTLSVVLSAPIAMLIARCSASLVTGGGLSQPASAWLTQITAGIPGLSLQLVAVGLAVVLIGRRR